MRVVIDEHTEDSPLIVRRPKILEALEEVQKRARARTLDEDVVHEFYRHYRRLRRKARREGIPIRDMYIRISGGGVSSSYKYSAETTRIQIKNGVLSVERARAPRNNKDRGTITGGFRGAGNGGTKTLAIA